MSMEADTRVHIDKWLENLGWHLDGKNKNVFLEQPRSEYERKKLKGKRPDYVLYSGQRDKPLMIIEAKRKGERVDRALRQGMSYAKALDAPIVFATDGLFCKSYHTKFNKTLLLNGEEVDEFLRELLAIKYLNTYEVNTISPKVQYSRQELIKIFNEANNNLRGEGLRAGIERFGEFANILFLKLISENEENKELHGEKATLGSSFRWNYIKDLSTTDRIDYINNMVYPKINELYGGDNIFDKLVIKSPKTLSQIINKIDPLTLTDINSDVKGDAFEYFLKESTASGNDLGEYFTPRHIVKTMVRLANPQIGEKIYDPFCGTGGLLIESFRHIWNTMPRNDVTKKILTTQTIYGNEITNTARITKMNMILAGDGHSNINMKDSLANPIDGKYDIVLTNMPYSQKTDYASLYDVKSNNGDSICVQHCMRSISKTANNGRMIIVVPEGFLFRKDLIKTREYMINNCELQSIISLPRGVFWPYTGVKTNIIYATKVNKKHIKKRNNYWYFQVKNDGYTLDSYRRKIPENNDLKKYEEYRKLDEDQKDNMLKVGFNKISMEKVEKNSYILVGNRYTFNENKLNKKYNNVKLEEIILFIKGVTYKKSDQVINETNNIILTADNITLDGRLVIRKKIYLNNDIVLPCEKKLNKNDIFICTSSGSKKHIGKVAFIDQNSKYYAGGFMGIIRVNINKCIPKYLYYYLCMSKKYKKQLENVVVGSNINNINSSILDIEVPLPSISDQKQIVLELDSYNSIVKNAKNIINNYKPIIPEVSYEKNITYFPLYKIAEFKPSKSELKNLKDNTLVSFVPMKDIQSHDILFQPKEMRELKDVIKGYTYFKNDDVLLAKITPCFENRKSGVARNLCNEIGFGSTEYIVIRPNSNKVLPEWIYYFISSDEFINEGKSNMSGTAGQQRVDINFVKNYEIPVPSIDIQKKVISQIDDERKLINSSSKLIEIFTNKMQNRINELFN